MQGSLSQQPLELLCQLSDSLELPGALMGFTRAPWPLLLPFVGFRPISPLCFTGAWANPAGFKQGLPKAQHCPAPVGHPGIPASCWWHPASCSLFRVGHRAAFVLPGFPTVPATLEHLAHPLLALSNCLGNSGFSHSKATHSSLSGPEVLQEQAPWEWAP